MKFSRIKKILLISMPAILIIGGVLFWVRITDYKSLFGYGFTDEKIIEKKEIKIEVKPEFYRTLTLAESKAGEVEKQKIRGGILPHHDLAMEMMADFFYKLKKSYPQAKNFIILGPNHDDLDQKIISAPVTWQTDAGNLNLANDLYKILIDKNLAAENFSVLRKEHSVQVFIPLIAHYFPEAKVLPIIITSTIGQEAIDAFALELSKLCDDETLILSSLDFSHYLPSIETSAKDVETLTAIEGFDYPKISTFKNDNIDSSTTLRLFLKTMDNLNAKNVKVLQNENSAHYLGHEIGSSTSYFTMFFY